MTTKIKSNKSDPRLCFVVGCLRKWTTAIKMERTGSVIKVCDACGAKMFSVMPKAKA